MLFSYFIISKIGSRKERSWELCIMFQILVSIINNNGFGDLRKWTWSLFAFDTSIMNLLHKNITSFDFPFSFFPFYFLPFYLKPNSLSLSSRCRPSRYVLVEYKLVKIPDDKRMITQNDKRGNLEVYNIYMKVCRYIRDEDGEKSLLVSGNESRGRSIEYKWCG